VDGGRVLGIFFNFIVAMNGGMVCKADANFAAHASLQPDARGTGVAQDPQYETGKTDCGADQIERSILENSCTFWGGTMSTNLHRLASPNRPQLLKVPEVAQMLGVKPRTIYEMVAQERIPYRKPPRSSILRFDLEEIVAWTKAGKSKWLGTEGTHPMKSGDFDFMMLYIAFARGCTSGKEHDNACS
jgi:excisionase family DNA binding protein